MRTARVESLGFLCLLSLLPPPGGAVLAQTSVLDQGLGVLLADVEAAQVELVRGHAEPFKALWSRGDDITLVGGLGGEFAKGWVSVSARLDWVATQYADGRRSHEETSRFLGQDFAVVVQRETIRFRVPGEQHETTQTLRATMVMRQESRAWRLVHCHADAQTVRTTTR